MQQQLQGPPQGNQLALTSQLLTSAPTVKDMFELVPVRNNWIQTYEKVTGRPDGPMRFEGERIMFMQLIASNSTLASAERFSLYASFTELAISGLTLRDGISYIIPYKGKAQFMVGWKGRLEQITEMPNVVHVHEPQVVYKNDEFEMELGMFPRIIVHKPTQADDKGPITHVYLVIEFTHGAKVYFMTRDQVINIRDQYSQSYKQYKQKLDAGKLEPWMDKPMWLTSEDQAFKKTIVKRVYGTLPKLPKHKYLDEAMSRNIMPGANDEQLPDPEELLLQQQEREQSNSAEHDFGSFVQLNDDGSPMQHNPDEFAGAQGQSEGAPPPPPPPPPPAQNPGQPAAPKAARTRTTKKDQPAQQQGQQSGDPNLYTLEHGSRDTVLQLIAKATSLRQLGQLRNANNSAMEQDSEVMNTWQLKTQELQYKSKYDTAEEIDAVVNSVTTLDQIAPLYFANAELIEKTPALKQKFAATKTRIESAAKGNSADTF